MRAGRVNKIKLTLGNDFIVDLFPLGGTVESQCDERTQFWGYPRSLDQSFKP